MTVAQAGDAVAEGVDIDAVAAAVEGCPSVDALVGGPPAMAATYLPGRRVEGVRVDGDTVTVQVSLCYGSTVARLAREVQRAVSGLVTPRRVDIVVADVSEPSTGM